MGRITRLLVVCHPTTLALRAQSHSKLFFQKKIKRVPLEEIVQHESMAQNSAWSMTGMSTLLGRDTTAGLLACKRRRLESEQQSEADLSRRLNLCAVLAVVIHDLEADRASIWRRNRLDWDKYLREMRHNHFRSMFRSHMHAS